MSTPDAMQQDIRKPPPGIVLKTFGVASATLFWESR